MNDYQYHRLAHIFGVIQGPALKAAIETGNHTGQAYSTEQLAAMCATSPAVFAARLAYWQSEEAPKAPPVITHARIDQGARACPTT